MLAALERFIDRHPIPIGCAMFTVAAVVAPTIDRLWS